MKTVLIVEDDLNNARVFSKILTKRGGLDVKHTENVEEVKEEFSQEQIENIIINLETEMYKAAEELDFEKAAQIRDQIAKMKREFAEV